MTHATHQILIIEDEPAIRGILRVVLANEGYELIEAATGARAEIEARSHKPDLLLVDLGLPDTDGLTVIRHVRAWSPVLTLGLVQIDLGRRITREPQGDIHLTAIEYRIVECLAHQAGMVARERHLLREVWGPDRVDDTRGLRVFINGLRQKLEADPHRPRYLLTEAGLGYRLWTDEAPLPC